MSGAEKILRKRESAGFALGFAGYVLWGLFPLYWPLLEPAGAVELLAHRVLWSALTMVLAVLVLRRGRQLRAILRDRRAATLLLVASAVIAVNWGGFIYGVNSGRVVETSLGYFINPLVTVLMGVAFLGERLRRLQWVALGVAAVAVLVIAVEYGRPPWIALLLAFSFGTYGLLKKQAGVEAIESLTFETLALVPLAAAYLLWLQADDAGEVLGHGAGHVALVATSGLVTAVPLLCFGAAAIRVPMTTLGLLQYLAPVLQFGIGVLVVGEDMSPGRWAGFALVWVALVVFTAEAARHRRRQLRLVASASAL